MLRCVSSALLAYFKGPMGDENKVRVVRRLIGSADFAQWLMKEGISSISLNPDSVVETWKNLASKS